MNTTEFRIGNLIQDAVSGHRLLVSELSEENITTTVIDRSKFPLPDGWQMEPIPLTIEIFKRNLNLFGYSGYYPDEVTYKISERLFILKNGWFGVQVDGKQIILNYNINYLHQLQNIYFALTGKELPYEL